MRIAIVLTLLLISAGVLAEPVRYVTDQLEITLRSGQSTRHQILRMLPSGTPVELLEEDADTGYSRVRTPQGQEGWVISRYLDTVPSARERLAGAEKELASRRITIGQLEQRNKELVAKTAALSDQVAELTRANQRLEQEITRIRRTSASALAIDDENKSLKERLNRLQRDRDILRQENEVLKDRTARDWFIVGAGVVLLGIAIGLVIPKIRWRRRSDWSRF